jgi:acetolactate synthase-1/2/3 large subunit
LIHLDLDPRVLGKMHPPTLGIVGDARDGLEALLAALTAGDPGADAAAPRAATASDWDWGWLEARRRARSPRYAASADLVIRTLRDGLREDAIVVSDQTGINYWMEWHFAVYAPRTFLYPVGSATLGYAVPAAIGARIARPDREVVAVVGDGGFLYSAHELATAVKYGLPIVIVVMNDGRYGAIRWLQQRIYGRAGEADLANPDFVALARAFGAEAQRLAGVDALGDALRWALGRPGPTLIELPLEVEPPWDL